MEIKFKADAAAINSALEVIKIIEPPALNQEGESGFLFVVGKMNDKKEDNTPGPRDGQDLCWVYSTDGFRVARAEFNIREVEGEGPFIFPLGNIGGFAFAEGEVEIVAKSDNDKHTVQFSFLNEKGLAKTVKASLDPRLFTTSDKKFNDAVDSHRYKTAILRKALGMSKKFTAQEGSHTTKDEHKVVNVYDPTFDKTGKGDGVLHAADGWRAFYFECDNFKGKGVQIHSDHMAIVEKFLAKVGPDVQLRTGKDMIFATSLERDRVLGWTKHAKPPVDFKYPPKSLDKVCLQVDKVRAVAQLKFIKSQMRKGSEKINVRYKASDDTITFSTTDPGTDVATSLPIGVTRATPLDGDFKDGYDYDVTLDKFLELLEGSEASMIELRMWPWPAQPGQTGKPVAGFRTLDEYVMDGEGNTLGGSNAVPGENKYKCTVTRFMASRH